MARLEFNRHAPLRIAAPAGNTAMTGKLDPEEVRALMARIFGEASQIITGYAGLIENFIGDAVMAVFGLNQAHQDDALRAPREVAQVAGRESPAVAGRIGRELANSETG